jgi:bacterioferritin-associated ferredoxin
MLRKNSFIDAIPQHPKGSDGYLNRDSVETSSENGSGENTFRFSDKYPGGYQSENLQGPWGNKLKPSDQSHEGDLEDKRTLETSGGDETIICRCERVSKDRVLEMIRAGCRDMNQIKAVLRTGMGACGGKTCTELILGLFKEEGVDLSDVRLPTSRPPEMEVPLGRFAGIKGSKMV